MSYLTGSRLRPSRLRHSTRSMASFGHASGVAVRRVVLPGPGWRRCGCGRCVRSRWRACASLRWPRPASSGDQILAIGLKQGFAVIEPVLRFEELHQCPLQVAVAQVAGHLHGLAAHRVDAGVPHAGGDVERAVCIKFSIRQAHHRPCFYTPHLDHRAGFPDSLRAKTRRHVGPTRARALLFQGKSA